MIIKRSILTWVHERTAVRSAGTRRLWSLILPFSIFSFFPNFSSAECTVICKSALNVSLPVSGSVSISSDILLEDDACNPNDFYVEIIDNEGNNLGNTVNCTVVGQSILAGVIHNVSGNSCYTTLNIQDYIKPQFNCTDTTVLCINPYLPQDIGEIEVNDNCTVADLTYSDNYIELACLTVLNGDTIMSRVERTWIATDESGNSATCVQNIYLKMATIAEVDFPAHRDGFAAPALDCMDDPTDLSVTGLPTVDGRIVSNEGICKLVVAHQDQIIADCSPNAYRILRTWTVINSCTGNFTLNVQIIKVADSTAPILQCPEDFTVGTHSYDCLATVNLPLAIATDDCSAVTITPSWAFGTGYGPFFDIPIGNHIVTYTAEDECGNTSTCTMEVDVVDDIIPIMVCDASTVVYLNSAGMVEIDALAFDDGSTDNCTLNNLGVSRDGINFDAKVDFDCLDADQTITVFLRAYDTNGNHNECHVLVTIREEVKPTLSCPSNISLTCTDDYTDLNLTGTSFAIDACGIDSIYFTDEVNINNCGMGNVNRTWMAVDVNGNMKACLQQISITDNTPVQVTFPLDYTTSICNAAVDTSITGIPLVIYDCEEITINYEDTFFDIAAPACYRIFRSWTVIDWCVYLPNSGSTAGYYTHTQLISVLDETAPLLNCPADTLVGALALTCEGTYVNIQPVTAMDCYPNVNFTNNSPYAIASGADASGHYPIGIHQVQFTAEDGCGNTSTCTMVIEVEDATPPMAACLEGVTIALAADGMAILTPEMLDNSSSDNCSASGNLSFEVSKDTFYCEDRGIQSVMLTVTDETNNTSSCTATIDVQDNIAVCPLTTTSLSGQILTEKGFGVEGVNVELMGTINTIVQTNENGIYTFENVPLGGNYTITPRKDVGYSNGVNGSDLILISRHVLGMSFLNSPYKVIASDVNESVNTTSFDLIEIRKLLLYIDTAFAQVESWTFVDSDYTFINPNFPLGEDYPQDRTINNLSGEESELNFYGIKTGDVNNSHDPSNLTGNDTRGDGPIRSMITDNQLLAAGNRYEIPFRVEDLTDILGFQFSLQMDLEKISFADLKISEAGAAMGIGQEHFGKALLDRGFLTASWTGVAAKSPEAETVLFYLTLDCHQSTDLKSVIQFNSQYTKAESYIENGAEVPTLGQIDLHFKERKGEGKGFEVEQNVPNPVRDQTTIRLNLPQAACGTLQLFDANGKMAYSQSYCGEGGFQTITFDRQAMNLSSGIYFMEFDWGNIGRQTIKMLVVD